MKKENSAVSSQSRRPKKTFLSVQTIPSKPEGEKKSNDNKKKESASEFDLDSLGFLRDKTRRKKSSGIDEKIKLLKTELKTLFNDNIFDMNYDSTDTMNVSENNDLLNFHKLNKTEAKILISNSEKPEKSDEHLHCLQNLKKKFKPVSTTTLSKSLEQLDDVADKIFDSTTDKNVLVKENLILNSKTTDFTENSELLAAESKSEIFKMSLLPQLKVEQMLYESFVMQHFKLNLPLLKEKSSDNTSFTTETKKKKPNKSKKGSNTIKVCDKGKFTQHGLTKYYKFSQSPKKMKTIDIDSSQCDLEIVNLDNSSSSNRKPKNATVCVNFNIKDSESFDVDGNEFHSEVEILNNYEENVSPVNQGHKSKTTNLNACYNENGKAQTKRAWECPVCFEHCKGQEIVATQCGHVFCRKCLENHFSKLGKSCPTCRSSLIFHKPFITLFNF